jgi:hypothetical protein
MTSCRMFLKLNTPSCERRISPADRESRKIRDETEWSLNDSSFNKIQSLRVDLDIDLFASRLTMPQFLMDDIFVYV